MMIIGHKQYAVALQKQLLMDRSIPMFNRLIVEKLQKKQLDLHHKRLDKIRANNRKHTCPVLRVQNAKGSQIEQQRRTEIEKQNIILFNKMNRIMNRSGLKYKVPHSYSRDNKHREQIDRIYEENKAIVNRIGSQKATISTKKLYQDRAKHEKLLRFMGRYPYRTQYLSKLQNSIDQPEENGFSQYQIDQRQTVLKGSPKEQRAKPQTAAGNQRSRSHRDSSKNPIMPPIERDHSQKIPLYKKQKNIDSVPSVVEVNRLYQEYEFKLTNLKTKREYALFLSEQQGNSLLTDYDYDYQYIASCFKVAGNQLIIELDQKPTRTQSNTQNKTMNVSQPRSLYNENKLKNFRLKEEQFEDEAKPSSSALRNVTESYSKPAYQFEDLGAFHHSDTLQPKLEGGCQGQVQIYYEQALDQQLHET